MCHSYTTYDSTYSTDGCALTVTQCSPGRLFWYATYLGRADCNITLRRRLIPYLPESQQFPTLTATYFPMSTAPRGGGFATGFLSISTGINPCCGRTNVPEYALRHKMVRHFLLTTEVGIRACRVLRLSTVVLQLSTARYSFAVRGSTVTTKLPFPSYIKENKERENKLIQSHRQDFPLYVAKYRTEVTGLSCWKIAQCRNVL
ncbi:hypothetical protein GGS26DRAFT_12962 [Hypomontagnella submonticulosa]|nr:hypothetical protein GGS26DRAFT_12962 [Hypomontagnella submonticulosa]